MIFLKWADNFILQKTFCYFMCTEAYSHSTIISFLVEKGWKSGFSFVDYSKRAILLPYYISLASSLVLRPKLLKWIIPNQVRILGSLAYKTREGAKFVSLFLRKIMQLSFFIALFALATIVESASQENDQYMQNLKAVFYSKFSDQKKNWKFW